MKPINMGILALLLFLHAQASGSFFTSSSLTASTPLIDTIRNSITIQLYPNPSSSWVFIKHPIVTNKLAQIVITNYNGIVIQKISTKLQTQQTIINISQLQAGFYFVTWQNGHETGTIKLQKN